MVLEAGNAPTGGYRKAGQGLLVDQPQAEPLLAQGRAVQADPGQPDAAWQLKHEQFAPLIWTFQCVLI